MKSKVYCLYRVSTLGQVEKDDIPMQKQCCHEFAAKHGWEIVREFSEKGISGFKVSAKDRDAIQEIQRDATEGKFDILLVYMFDRLGRKEDETPFVVEWFVRNGIEVWSTIEGQQRFDNHVDKLMNYIRYWQASGESIKTSIRTKTRLGQLVQEGKFRGGVRPYGYDLVKRGRTGKKNRELYEIEVNKAESIVVRKMYELCVEHGYGARLVSSELAKQGMLNQNNEPFHYATVRNMLHNILYTGRLRSGETVSEIFPELQIIDMDTFDRAQEIMKQRSLEYEDRLRNVPKRVSGKALLSSNIYCGHCGSRMFASTARKSHYFQKNTENIRIPVYKCYNRTKGPEHCSNITTFRAAKIDEAIRELLSGVFDRATQISEKDLVDKKLNTQIKEYDLLLKKAKNEYSTKKGELAKLDSHMISALDGTGSFTPTQLQRRMDALEQELDVLRDSIAQLEGSISETSTLSNQIQKEYRKLQKWADVFLNAPIETQKMIVSEMLEKVTISRGYELDVKLNITLDQYMGGF